MAAERSSELDRAITRARAGSYRNGDQRLLLAEVDRLQSDHNDLYQTGYDAGHADGYNDGRTDRFGGPCPLSYALACSRYDEVSS